MRWSVALCTAVAAVARSVLPAWGHGEFESSTPAADSTVKKAPRVISVTLSEAPGPGTTIRVIDGCKKNVVTNVRTSGEVAKAALREGQPGNWQVRFRAVSAVDGHTTGDEFDFKVKGRPNCSPKKTQRTPEVAGGEGTRIKNPNPPDESGFPIVPFAIGSVALVVVALMIRKSTSE